MALQSYLPDRAGGEVAAAVFDRDETALVALRELTASGMRWQEVTVLAADRRRAKRIATEGGAWSPALASRLPLVPFGPRLPREVRSRYGRALGRGALVIVVAEGVQKAETIAALFERAGGADVQTWWQGPTGIFPSPEEGGPL